MTTKFKNAAAEFVYYRTYSKWNEQLQRRETWEETVDRVMTFLKEERGDKVPSKVFKKIKEGMLNFSVLPSMRLVWAAGEAARKTNVCVYNCSFLPVDSIEAFAECLYILCCGSGVGFSVESKHVDKLPVVARLDEAHTPRTLLIGDTKEAWADSVKILMASLYEGRNLYLDYSSIRPKGSPLKTMGGRASGPDPLIVLHSFIKETMNKAQGRKLTTLECHDIMNKVAEIVVAGGVRRSSQVSMSDLGDEEMRNAKVWPFPQHRAMANNSAVFYSKPSAVDFLAEWSALASSGTGERGIFNMGAAKLTAPQRRNASLYAGGNPCQPASASVLTPGGIRTFADIDVGSVIWSGTEWTTVKNKWRTGEAEVFVYTTSMGKFVGTATHKILQKGERIEVGKAQTIDWALGDYTGVEDFDYAAVVDGLVLGDGTVHKASSDAIWLCAGKNDDYSHCEITSFLSNPKAQKEKGYSLFDVKTSIVAGELVKTYNREIPARFMAASSAVKKSFLRGLYTANGSVVGKGKSARITLKQSSRKLIEQAQEMLSSLGIHSYITANKPTRVKFKNGEYLCKQSYDLNITSHRGRFVESIGFVQAYKMAKVSETKTNPKYLTAKITDVVSLGVQEVFDIEVTADSHTYWTSGSLVSNCMEILLRSNEFCNLSTVIVSEQDDLESLLEKVETATWIGSIQSTFTDFPYLRPEWKENCDAERLLGVSLSGQMDNPGVLTPDALKAMKAKAIKVAKRASSQLEINMPAAITCGKPEGTTSQLVSSGSGAHPWYSPYYIRRYRISGTDPLFRMMRDQGFTFTPENGQTADNATTWVVSFPVKAPETAVFRADVTAINQLEWYKQVQTNWCEHNQSITVYVKDHEWFDVGNWVYNNWDLCIGVSFLPYDGGKYQQAPYEEITEAQYTEMLAKFPAIDYSKLSSYENEDQTEGAKTFACTGDRCELV